MQLKKSWSCFCLDFCCIFSHVPHLFADTFHRKSIWPTGFCLPIKVLRRLGGDTSIQWHHWGSKDQDPKERNFMNFASMASYSCILPAYLDLKRRSSLKVEMCCFCFTLSLVFFVYCILPPTFKLWKNYSDLNLSSDLQVLCMWHLNFHSYSYESLGPNTLMPALCQEHIRLTDCLCWKRCELCPKAGRRKNMFQ